MARRDRLERSETHAAACAERERITRVYDRYDASGMPEGQWGKHPAASFIRHVKWRAVEEMVGTQSAWPPGSWIMDLGAGKKSEVADLGTYARPAMTRILAVDLLARSAHALAHQAGVHVVMGHGALLPVATGSVMAVFQSLMLSSVLDTVIRAHIYAEIARVIAPGGLFVSYDTRYVNPVNPHTRPVALRELRRAFTGWRLRHRSLTGLPPLLRWLAPRSLALCRAVERIPPLRSHRLVVARKPGS